MNLEMTDMGDSPELNRSARESLKTPRKLNPGIRKSESHDPRFSGDAGKGSKSLELPRGIRSKSRDSGMLLLLTRIKMEGMGKQKSSAGLPDLGLLKHDKNIAAALEFEALKDKEKLYSLRLLREILKMHNLMDFSDFAPLQIMFVEERNLSPVDDVIYGKLSGLAIPADSELEAPENYNP
jgi:hypothetical protein